VANGAIYLIASYDFL